ncbi:MAG: ribonuclease E activity regulator RraA [Betaproteobacteria bacterium]|nr:ribonuclease E activity regulator RraA [Betaproteobacteria bacterium]MDE1980915.1 ribonuclease E activity regulator RraA [Betaproteobacteria bacterium]MDE2131772.1 ribonuclease E activity regulator RraA [Betaproteobacteria bacterium]MDE2211637.1 ribonuclease E activity regulator RraA [Betaproteobacteria bacterium]MDE2354012.1 ribonuclease E activity regulator RraA [Betaproteobacteria bacterium]
MAHKTADLCDQLGDAAAVADPVLANYGGMSAFGGQIATVKVFEDNSLVRVALETPGFGRVLVIDGGGSLRCALVGDQLATLGVKHGWAGIIVYGCIRDSLAIAEMDIGVQALGTHPRRSIKKGEGAADIPVTFAGVTFRPGAWLYADDDGLLVTAQRVSPL